MGSSPCDQRNFQPNSGVQDHRTFQRRGLLARIHAGCPNAAVSIPGPAVSSTGADATEPAVATTRPASGFSAGRSAVLDFGWPGLLSIAVRWNRRKVQAQLEANPCACPVGFHSRIESGALRVASCDARRCRALGRRARAVTSPRPGRTCLLVDAAGGFTTCPPIGDRTALDGERL